MGLFTKMEPWEKDFADSAAKSRDTKGVTDSMGEEAIRFDDGAAYERGMGIWSQLVGSVFLDWLSCPPGLRWIDIGCGNGAFTELLIQRCAPHEAQGVDPSSAQIAYARTRPGTQSAEFQVGDAMALPFDDHRFDAAVMALVLFFVPKPAKGLSEMVRVVRPGGLVSAYVWDIPGGGLPVAPILNELPALGFTPVLPPSAEVSHMEVLRDLWIDAGLEAVETRVISVERTFPDFQDYWDCSTGAGSMRSTLAQMTPDQTEEHQRRVRERLPADASGQITLNARVNAIQGRVPSAS